MMMQATGGGGGGIQSSHDAMVIAVNSTYRDGGRDWQQLNVFTLELSQLNSQFGHYGFWGVKNAMSMRAPRGRLDAMMPAFMAVANSLQLTPQWAQKLVNTKLAIMKINHQTVMSVIQGQMQIAQTMYRANQEVSDYINQGYRQRQSAQDAGQRDFIHYVHDTQEYADPRANTNVALPTQYERVFSNGQGEYILTNDLSFEPGRQAELTVDWSQIQRVR